MMKTEIIERVGRVGAVVVGGALLVLTYVGPARWWHALGVVPLAMGMSGW